MNIKQSVLVVVAFGVLIGISGIADSVIIGDPSDAKAQPAQSVATQVLRDPVQAAAANPEKWFEELVTAYSHEAGGVSLQQASVLADIAAATGSTAEQQRRFKELVREFALANGGISLNEMSAIAGVVGEESSVAAHLRPRSYGSRTSDEPAIRTYGQPISSSDLANTEPSRRALNDELNRSSARSRLGSIDRYRSPETIALNPAGPGLYSGSNGDMYTRAGPNGVINTRTGEFTPTN